MPIIRVKNHTPLKKIGETLREAKSVLLFTHTNIDGDCAGSAAAVCRLLRRLGKEASILLSAPLPEYLSFLAEEENGEAPLFTTDPETDIPALYEKPDVCLAVDCSDARRFSKFEAAFGRGKTIAIDHHVTNDGFASMNYVDDRAANGENVWNLFRAMGEMPTKKEAQAIYTAIVTDTGRFQYDATNAETLRIAARLYECGLDQKTVTIHVYQSERFEKVALHTRILSRVELLADGAVAFAAMPYSDLEETGAAVDETEGLVEQLRNMKGVEVACFVREAKGGDVKVSLRSKKHIDVSKIAAENGGGGHVFAAGYNKEKTTLAAESAFVKEALVSALNDPNYRIG